MKIKKMGTSIHIVISGIDNSCFAGVEAESKSHSIFLGRSRSWSRSRLKFVDYAGLRQSAYLERLLSLRCLEPPEAYPYFTIATGAAFVSVAGNGSAVTLP